MDQKLLESLGQKNSKNQMKSISRTFLWYFPFHFWKFEKKIVNLIYLISRSLFLASILFEILWPPYICCAMLAHKCQVTQLPVVAGSAGDTDYGWGSQRDTSWTLINLSTKLSTYKLPLQFLINIYSRRICLHLS